MATNLEQYQKYAPYLDFIERYKKATNAADGSERDANANVECKNITTMEGEIFKRDFVNINRLAMWRKLKEMYGEPTADEYLRQLEEHEIYRHDETAIIGKPYTYAAQEAILVKTPQGVKLASFEDLFEMCPEPSITVDSKNRVYQKHPVDWFVLDRGTFTPIQTITKKQRHRDLVCVKTQFGEDVIVTDNHPMIVDDDPTHTVIASEAAGQPQYRCEWDDATLQVTPRAEMCIAHGDNYNLYTIVKRGNYQFISAPNIKLDADLGYFIGFFVAEGWFVTDQRTHHDSMMIKVKGSEPLLRCTDALFRSTGIAATIQDHEDWRGMRTLKVNHPDFVDFCINTMHLGRTAPQKKCPIDILAYPKEFRIGFVCGLLDGDGTVDENGTALIRLSSRTCISQLSYVLRSIGVPCAMWHGDSSGKEGVLIKANYPLFGISFPLSDMFSQATKYTGTQPKFSKYKCGWGKALNVKKIDNEYFLRDNEFIYDITTGTHTFVLNNIWVHNCVSMTMYPFLYHGITSIGGLSSAPTNVHSFIGGFINLVFAVASQFAGAVSTPEWLPYFDYFLRKEYGNDYYLRADDLADLSKKRRSIKQVIYDLFQQTVYSICQPAAARNFQSVFWNIAYYDQPYFNGLYEDFVFPDGDTMRWESVSWLQELFMNWFNEERRKKILTFPVETISLLHNGKEFLDPYWADKTAEMWSKGHSFFCYTSDSVDSLSSCCFAPDTQVLAKSSSEVFLTSLEELHQMPSARKHNLTVFHNGSWVSAKTIKLPGRPMYRVTTSNDKTVAVTDNHLFPTLRGDVRADELTTDDYIMFNTRGLEQDEAGGVAAMPAPTERDAHSIECWFTIRGINSVITQEGGMYYVTPVALDAESPRATDTYLIRNNSMYFRVSEVVPAPEKMCESVYCFEVANQDEPYFTLPSGMITHNCRLKNEIQDNTFSYTLGAGGVSTGSKCVITMNINRLVQNATRANRSISEAVAEQTEKIHKYLLAFNAIMKEYLDAKLLPVYDAGFISMDKQYLTLGINGFVEGAEFLGIDIRPDNPAYTKYGESILKPIYELNRRDRDPKEGIMFNTEAVPAENLGVKFAKWDKQDGYFVPRECYNSYFYLVEDDSVNVLDKFQMSGRQFTKYLDGGSAYHCNLDEHLSKEQYRSLLHTAIDTGCPYFTFNIPNTICNDCGHISKHRLTACPKCGSHNLDYATRVIGYLKRVSCFSEARRKEEKRRAYGQV